MESINKFRSIYKIYMLINTKISLLIVQHFSYLTSLSLLNLIIIS